MGLVRRSVVVVALALAAACSKGGSGGNAGSSGSSGDAVRSADGVVASVEKGKVQVRTQDGRTLAFPMQDDTKVTLGGGEASTAVVTQGAPVRVSFRGSDASPDVVSIDVEPKIHAGNTGQPPAAGKFQANGGNEGDAHARPPQPAPETNGR